MKNQTAQPHDLLDRPINPEDYVVFHNNIYQVVEVGKARYGNNGPVRIILLDKSKTTRPVNKNSRDCCLLNKDEVLLWILKGKE